MKRLSLIVLSLMLLGAGCLGRTSGNSAADAGVFFTTSSGEEWAQSTLVPTAQGIGTLATTNVLDLVFDPQDNSFLYIATANNGLLYSEDGAKSWRQSRVSDLQSGTVTSVAPDSKDVCTVYVAKGSNLYKSVDCMRSFDSETYVDNRGETIVKVVVDWYDSDNIWIGLENGDVIKSEDKGNTWKTVLNAGKLITSMLMSRSDSRQILVGTASGIQKTLDGGTTWTQMNDGFADYKSARKIFALTQHVNEHDVIAATGYGLLRSKDFGATWEALNLVTSPGQVEIRAVAMDPKNSNIIYYAANSTFYLSLDGGQTWKTERLPSARTPTTILVDPLNQGVLYVAVASLDD